MVTLWTCNTILCHNNCEVQEDSPTTWAGTNWGGLDFLLFYFSDWMWLTELVNPMTDPHIKCQTWTGEGKKSIFCIPRQERYCMHSCTCCLKEFTPKSALRFGQLAEYRIIQELLSGQFFEGQYSVLIIFIVFVLLFLLWFFFYLFIYLFVQKEVNLNTVVSNKSSFQI